MEPSELVVAARRARDALELDRHERLVDELEVVTAGDERLELVVAAERLRDAAFRPLGEDGWRRTLEEVERLLESPHADPEVTARLRLAAAGLLARVKDHGWATACVREYEAAARAFSRAGDLDGAARAIGQCSWSADLLVAGLRKARSRMTESIQLAASDAVRAGSLSQRAKINVWLGDIDAAAQDVAACLAMEGDLADTTVAYVAWAEINVLAARGDTDGIAAALDRATAHQSSWYDTVTGVQFDAQLADVLASVGMKEEAFDRLERAIARRDQDPAMVTFAELAVHARLGDPALAVEHWEEVRRSSLLEPWEKARLGVLAAHAMRRLDMDAGPTAARAFDDAAIHARPDMPLVREAEAARSVLEDAARAGSTTAARLRDRIHSHRLQLLGRVQLTSPDGEVVVVTGRQARLLASLAATGGPINARRLGQSIWPDDRDADELAGRVRRLVHRVRSTMPVVERDDVGQLHLRADTAVDLHELEDAVRRVREAGEAGLGTGHFARARELAATADHVQLESRDDLPVAVRTRVSRLLHWVHRRAAELERDRGRDDLAREELRMALVHGPDDDVAAAALARSLVGEGRRGEAADLLRDTRDLLDVAGIRPSRTFLDLAATLLDDAAD